MLAALRVIDGQGKAKIEENELELKSIKVADKGGISMTLDYEAEGIPGLFTIKVEADGNNVLEGGWAFASADGSENHEGKLSATRATKKRGVLRGR